MKPNQNDLKTQRSLKKDLSIMIKLYSSWIQFAQEKKIELVQNHTFNPYAGFEAIDKFGSGYLTIKDFIHQMKLYKFELNEDEARFLVLLKGRGRTIDEDGVKKYIRPLTRDDVLTYDDFLNIIAPTNKSYLADKFSNMTTKYEGNLNLLPEYTFRSMMEIFCIEVEIYRKYERLKDLLISKYGYCATLAYKLFNDFDDNRPLTYKDFKEVLMSANVNYSPEEYDYLCHEIDWNFDGVITKQEFQDLITPNDEFMNFGKDRKLEHLNDKDFKDYIKNAYNFKEVVKEEVEGFKQNHAWECMQDKLGKIYDTGMHTDPDHPVNKHLLKDKFGRVYYDVTSKRGASYMPRGFESYYDDYFKQRFMGDKEKLLTNLTEHYERERDRERRAFELMNEREKKEKCQTEHTLDQNQVQRQMDNNLKNNLDIFNGIYVQGNGNPQNTKNYVNTYGKAQGDNYEQKGDYEAIKTTTRRVLENVQYVPNMPEQKSPQAPENLGENIFINGLDFMNRESLRTRPRDNNFTLNSSPNREHGRRILFEDEAVPRERS